MIWIILIVVILAILITFVYTQSKGFVTERYTFTSDIISKDVHFVFLSDLHETQHDKGNRKLIDAIDEISPDFVLIGGDMITSYKDIDDDFYKTLDFLREIGNRYKTIYVPGNHERALYDLRECDFNPKPREKDNSDIERINELDKVLLDCGIITLRNERIDIGEVTVLGLDLPLLYYRRLIRRIPEIDYLRNSVGQVDENKYTIMLAHDPEHFDEYSKVGAQLVLSGHIHGGIVRVPGLGGVISPQLKIFPKYDSGVFKKDKCDLLISRGIGTHSIPIRIFNKAEICDVVISSCVNNGEAENEY